MADLKALYQEVILDHNRNPRNFRILADATRMVEGYNPLCGDHYTVYVKMDGEKVVDVAFQGSGCAISKSSASVMSTLVKGKDRNAVLEMFDTFHQLVRGERKGEEDVEQLGKLAAFAGVSDFPARVKCAILPWHTMKNALESNDQTVSTE